MANKTHRVSLPRGKPTGYLARGTMGVFLEKESAAADTDFCVSPLQSSGVLHTNKLFIYGTLADPKIQRSVWGRETTGVPDVLREYRRSEIEIDGEIYPLIIPSKEGHVEGLVIEVADDELEKIDDYETDAYERVEVILESGAIAWVYVRG